LDVEGYSPDGKTSSVVKNRIDSRFAQLRSEKRKGFIPYICAGDPNFDTTIDLTLALEKNGADLVELGLPFSDPLADGIVNQLAAQRALAAGATVRGVFDCVCKIRQTSQVPIVLYSYLNPIFQFGFDNFHREASSAGVDGLLILDLPPEEDTTGLKLDGLQPSSFKTPVVNERRGQTGAGGGALVHIRLIAPTTPQERIKSVAMGAEGFLYYVSREGVTGARETLVASLEEKIAQLREFSDLPIAVGFGISNPEQAREVARYADGVVVGSALVDLIAKHGTKPDLIEKVSAFARHLATAIHR
jgi:tryptophan synthase alpha chain